MTAPRTPRHDARSDPMPPPSARVRIIVVSGAEGERVRRAQTEAIREVLRWVQAQQRQRRDGTA